MCGGAFLCLVLAGGTHVADKKRVQNIIFLPLNLAEREKIHTFASLLETKHGRLAQLV